jgi:DNA modification methylase
MKPIPLLATPILNSTQTNGIVLEPFGGSGSTLICCEQLGRVCYAIELDERFVDVIVERFRSVNPNATITVERDNCTLTYEEAIANV